jgi:hypothetical protein
MNKLKILFTTLTMVVFSCFLSCKDSVEESIVVPTATTAITDEVIQKLKNAGFDTSEGLSKYNDGYLVEYDIYLTEADIDNLLNDATTNGRVNHYHTTSMVTGAPRTIRVFMDTQFGSFMQTAFDNALTRYNNLGLSLTFQRTTNPSQANISIFAFYEVSNVLGMSGGFPTGGNPASTISLNTFYYNNSSQRADATTTVAHEIGHAIGFRHTDYMNRSFSCGGGGLESDPNNVGAVHIPGSPLAPSAASWMLACSNNTDRPFNTEDVNALNTVYGQAQGTGNLYAVQDGALIRGNQVNGARKILGLEGEWVGTNLMTSVGGNLYMIQGSALIRTNPTSGAWTVLGSGTEWSGTSAMTSYNGNLYMVQGGALIRTNPSNGVWTIIGNPTEWFGTTAIAASGSNLYIIQGAALVRANPNTGAWTVLGDGTEWSGTNLMTSIGSNLYMIQNGALVRANSSNGAWTVLGDGTEWSGSNGLTAYNGNLYVIQSSYLVQANPSNGAWSVIGNGSEWSRTTAMASN